MDRASPISIADDAEETAHAPTYDRNLVERLYTEHDAARLGWTLDSLAAMLDTVAARCPEDIGVSTFLNRLHLQDLLLAQACARGYESAWAEFLATLRAPLWQAATAITKSVSLGEELADSLYAELFGLKETNGERRSPLTSYSGRGSLMGWLRTTLAQRHIDRFRKTQRETPIADRDFTAPPDTTPSSSVTHSHLESAISTTLGGLDGEERFLLVSYFLDGRTLLEIARLLRVHEATVSRKLKRITASVRKQLLRQLQVEGLSRRAAEETLGTDSRDVSINLRKILQTSTGPPFQEQ